MKTIATFLITFLFLSIGVYAQKTEHFGDKINADGALSVSEFKEKMKSSGSHRYQEIGAMVLHIDILNECKSRTSH